MIELYQGRIGGGKTYSAVRRIIKYLAAGRTVYTNIEFNLKNLEITLAKRFSVAFDVDQLRELPELTDHKYEWHEMIDWGVPSCPVLVVIDEAQLHYNSRDWAETQKRGKDMLSFLTQSRKAFVDVIYITQEVGNIDKQFRVLCQFIWTFRNMEFAEIPIFGGLLSKSFFFRKDDYGGAKIDSGLIPKEKDYFLSYNTFAFLDPKMAEKAEKEMEKAIAERAMTKLNVKQRLAIIRGEHSNLPPELLEEEPLLKKCKKDV
jgi:hypothetical protein